MNKLVVENAQVAITSGTASLRTVRATHAVFHEDTRYLEATSVTLSLRIPQRNMSITAHAMRGEVFLAASKSSGPVAQAKSAAEAELKAGAKAGLRKRAVSGSRTEPKPAEKTVEQSSGKSEAFKLFRRGGVASSPVGLEGMRKLASLPLGEHAFGDVILHGPITGRTSDGGTFETQTVMWSEQLKRLMVPFHYTQTVFPPQGGEMESSGSGFEVDSTMRNWMYYAREQPCVFIYDPPKKQGAASSNEGKVSSSSGATKSIHEGRSPAR